MLLKHAVLEAIRAGDVDLVYRRWKRPTVKKGGTLTTKVGMLEILSVDVVEPDRITTRAARRAGFADRADLLASLGSRDGALYRIRVKLGGEDPRIALRNESRLKASDITEIQTRLDRMDRASRSGPWTRTVLKLIADQPGVRAPDLAEGLGLETKPFKTNVRKLKALGLTESLRIGYQLSPRGRRFLERT